MDDSKTPTKTAVSGVRNEVSFPFLMGTRKLSRPFQVGGGKCGLSASACVPSTRRKVAMAPKSDSGTRRDGNDNGD